MNKEGKARFKIAEEGFKKAIASRNTVLVVKAGSEALGISSESSDFDYVGVYLDDMKDIAGFAPDDNFQYRSATVRTGLHNAKSEPGDIDLSMYGLRKFVMLALGGNPNILNVLYDSNPYFTTEIGTQLQFLKEKIVSVRAAQAFLGYLRSQRDRLVGSIGQKGVNRDALEAAYGYDTKYAMHVMRLGMQGLQLLTIGKLSIPMQAGDAAYLRSIHRGEETLNSIINAAATYEKRMQTILDAGVSDVLRATPDRAYMENWLLNTLRTYWTPNEDAKASQQYGIAADTQRKDEVANAKSSEEVEDSLWKDGNPFI